MPPLRLRRLGIVCGAERDPAPLLARAAARAAPRPPRLLIRKLRRVRRVALVACALAVAGCGSSGGKATVSRSELPRTVLQPADVPGSWTQFADEEQARIDMHPGPRQSPTRFGREDGWISRYRGTEHNGAVVVESRADVFDSVGGAKKDLDAYRAEIKAGVPGS